MGLETKFKNGAKIKMANTKEKKSEVTWIAFRSLGQGAKRSWVLRSLMELGIPYELDNSATGTLVRIPTTELETATGLMMQELGSFTAESLIEIERATIITVTPDDLPDEHQFFHDQLVGLMETERAKSAEPRGESVVVTQALESIETAESEDESEDDDDDDWDFGDEDEDDEIEAKTVVSDPDIELATDPEPEEKPKVKVHKKKKEKQEVADPDFEGAEEESVLEDDKEYEQADELMQFEDVQFKDVKTPIRMYDTNSGVLSAIGAKILTKDPLIVTLYVRFKSGDSVYRYNPVALTDWQTIMNLAIKRTVHGIQEASAGSFFHHAIRVKADDGIISCQRLADKGWVNVLPKSERTKQIKNRDK